MSLSPSQPAASALYEHSDPVREGREHRGEWRARRLFRREDRTLAEGQANRQNPASERDIWWGPVNIPCDEHVFENQPRARYRLPQHAERLYLRRWFRRMGSEVSHEGPRHLLAAVSRPLHAHDAHPPDTTMNVRTSARPTSSSTTLALSRRIVSPLGWVRRTASTSVSRTRHSSSPRHRICRRDEEGVFTVMNYFVPKRGVLSMHCSAPRTKRPARLRCSSASAAQAKRRSRQIPSAASSVMTSIAGAMTHLQYRGGC